MKIYKVGILGIAGELDEGDNVAANYRSVFPRGGWYKRVAGKPQP
jgi:hypothetical protein